MEYWLLALAILIAANWLSNAVIEAADQINDTIDRLIIELQSEEEEE